MHDLMKIARKEFNGFFASPAAFLFLGVFLAVTLFVFFWGESFFSRNLADVRPLFSWMPILLIFLVAALTMRSWSEERRAGTLETLLTSPIKPVYLVLGKFLAGLGLVALALLLTLPIPFTVSLLGALDWGPVFGGYLAALFLAAAYVAIGLYMSSRTDNPIVALILTTLVCAIFYLIGSPVLGNLLGYEAANVLSLLGTGSRFESITRGVLDARDLYYYLSIVGVFLILNVYTLEKLRWAGNPQTARHRSWNMLVVLATINVIVANLWLNPIGSMRGDMTQGQRYSLSESTEQYLKQLQEPLLIRGYFSAQTHALLAPLVPEIRDLLEEYAVMGKGKVQVEFVDPHDSQSIEEEAASKYGIRPIPFRMDSKYQTGVVNSYFHLVIAYGDQYETLSFEDLIDVKVQNESDIDVVLKNPEYAITRSIRKSLTTYQAGGNPFDMLTQPVTFKGYMSPKENMPEALVEVREALEKALGDLKEQAGDKLIIEFADPDANGGELAQQLEQDYGFGPQIASLFDPQPFWFYMLLSSESGVVQIPLPEELSEEGIKRSLQASVQRLAPGFLKTIALIKPEAPPSNPMMAQFGMPPEPGKQYNMLMEILSENARITETDLKEGRVPADADLLLVMAPDNLDEKQLFAIDQFLMQGGSVVLATSPYDIKIAQSINASQHTSGMKEWLAHHGLNFGETLVLDPQNASLPLPVERQLGQFTVNEIQMMPYPHFPDIRDEGLNQDSAITSGLGQLSLNWASPITLDTEKNTARKTLTLAQSSEDSWTSSDLNMIPDYQQYPDSGFALSDERAAQTLAVAVEGRFESYFKGKDSPLAAREDETDEATENPEDPAHAEDEAEEEKSHTITSVIEHSPDSSRIILVGANTFATDTVLQLASQGLGSAYTKPLEFLQNAVDWSLEDRGLLMIRSRASFARTLKPMGSGEQMFWESLNYILALLGLILIWFWRKRVRENAQQRYQAILKEV